MQLISRDLFLNLFSLKQSFLKLLEVFKLKKNIT